jgi:hypothetical protein
MSTALLAIGTSQFVIGLHRTNRDFEMIDDNTRFCTYHTYCTIRTVQQLLFYDARIIISLVRSV